MTFVEPWILAALVVLPVIWFLLRVTPPAPRTEAFPAIRLLLGLQAHEETPARTPPWLLLLRIVLAGLVIVALARPVLDAGGALAGQGPVLLVIDNGWAAAAGWAQRQQAATSVLDRAERAGRQGALLTTAPDESGNTPAISAVMPVPELRARLAAVRPLPWPSDRAAAASALRAWHDGGTAIAYVADGLTDGGDFQPFADALAAAGAVTVFCCDATPSRVLRPSDTPTDQLTVRVAQQPWPEATQAAVLAQSGDGRTLGRADFTLAAGATEGAAVLDLPLELRNKLARLVLEGPPSAGSVLLLDERWRRRPVGLVTAEQTSADAPFAGPLYYLRRALSPYAEVRVGEPLKLLQRELSVLVLADRPVAPGAERDALAAWVEKGGMLIRFAGPRIADTEGNLQSEPLLPVPLLPGDRQLGGAMSWSEPAGLAAFPLGSPFNGLAVPADVKVSRQVLAEPKADLGTHAWATLADGTPLVTMATRGAGRIVLFHVTANADWSNLPLSGLFVDMLRRLVAVSAGVPASPERGALAPVQTMDGFGQLAAPQPGAASLAGDAFGTTAASPRHPPGLYGPENQRRALNLGAVPPALAAAPRIAGARDEPLSGPTPERELGPWVLAAAVLLLAADTLISLVLRGLWRSRAVAAALFVALGAAHPALALESDPNPALVTRLGYILSGDAEVDGVAKAGLEGLSDYVNRRTAAALAEPDPIEPGRTDLSFYPLLYWPIIAAAGPLKEAQTAALNSYLAHGGIILIDTRDSGSGEGFAPGTDSALRRVVQGLTIPALTELTTAHVLARSFYLLADFPGRFTGEPVWVQRDQDRMNDSVSPVIIGGNDWASAWAVDATGGNPYAVMPGGQRQRVLAYRFGVNLVMYALTGNYKGDQVHVPAILQRLGQ